MAQRPPERCVALESCDLISSSSGLSVCAQAAEVQVGLVPPTRLNRLRFLLIQHAVQLLQDVAEYCNIVIL